MATDPARGDLEPSSFDVIRAARVELVLAMMRDGLDGLLRTLHDDLARQLAVADDADRVLVATDDVRPPVRDPSVPTDGVARRQGDWLACALGDGEGSVTTVWMADPDGSASDADRNLLELATAICVLSGWCTRSVAEAEARVFGGLASELLLDGDRRHLRQLVNTLRYDADRPHRVAAIRPPDGVAPAARAQLAGRGVEALTSASDGELFLLLPLPSDLEAVNGACEAVCRGRHTGIGVSAPRPDAWDLAPAVREAVVALELAERSPGRPLVRFDELGVLQLFLTADEERLADFASQELEPLLLYDATHGTDLTQTLHAFLRHEGGLVPTAAELHVHRSTLRYRLGRIRDLLATDLDDPARRLALRVATEAVATFRDRLGRAGWPMAPAAPPASV